MHTHTLIYSPAPSPANAPDSPKALPGLHDHPHHPRGLAGHPPPPQGSARDPRPGAPARPRGGLMGGIDDNPDHEGQHFPPTRIAFTVRGEIAAKGSLRARPWRTKDGSRSGISMVQSSSKAKSSQALVADRLSAVMVVENLQAIEGPVSVSMTLYRRKPKSYPKRKASWPITKPDIDKQARLVLDALSGIAFADDAQVVRLVAEKCWGEPGVDVLVESWRQL